MLIRIGDVEIWRILEHELAMAPLVRVYPDLDGDPDAQALFRDLAPRQVDADGMWVIPVQSFLLKSPSHVILIDACVGNDKSVSQPPEWANRTDDRFLAGLTAAGVTPGDVDYVLCTHLHVDHTGWNTRLLDGRWVPTFPKARYLLPAEDNAHFSVAGPDGGPTLSFSESVAPVIAAGQADFVSGAHALGDHVTLVPAPGHTPGHVSVHIQSNGAQALITGDAMHSPAQCARPDWRFAWDVDTAQAAESRVKFLGLAAESGAKVLGSHFPLPSVGRVTAKGNAFRFTED
ncbi:MBL fold metallo-hydrolase [Chachezhania sediminis]|uniref:MBL fold metallo-hydrolase n=1 Tax=Chachezhania sediminis TaxID=2599291 RepID=UPI00131D5D07|nr:MBL fold metallo-hydrolase [Chachezhania sediminis]